MTQATLGVLEQLRPPAGFRTEATFGTTYSADLLACMAVLTTLDGGEGEQIRYGRIEAYRALDRLRGRVRLFHNLGCLSRRNGSNYPSLALLDRVLVPVTVPGSGSFHPKVWLSRQVDSRGLERFVLIVSSRNVTTSTDWDFGVALEGKVGGPGVPLPRLKDFVKYVCALARDRTLLDALAGVDAVRWERPRGVKSLAFDYQESAADAHRLHPVWATFRAKPAEVLLLSPFIDGRMVHEAAKRWGRVAKRKLVAGTEGLVNVAVGSRREELRELCPSQLSAASDFCHEAVQADEAHQGDEEEEQSRALHAKVIALIDGRKSTLVAGSNNLTSHGWCGGSVEAFVCLHGDESIAADLLAWQKNHALDFTFPEVDTPAPSKTLLESEGEKLRSVRFRLDHDAGEQADRLSLAELPALQLAPSLILTVSRYTTPKDAIVFPPGAGSVLLPPCSRALRTALIACTLQAGDEQTAWTTQVMVQPPIDDIRDRELVAHLLSPRDFLDYLQALGADEPLAGPEEGDTVDDSDMRSSDRSSRPATSLTLESLLARLANQPSSFFEFDQTIKRYGDLIKGKNLSDEDGLALRELLDAWSAIREARLR